MSGQGDRRVADDLTIERVLRAVEVIPAGRAASYGDIAALVGIGPRQVGAILSAYGSGVTWWRVCNASGVMPGHLTSEALSHWRQEGTPVAASGRGIRLAAARVEHAEWAAAHQRACADLE